MKHRDGLHARRSAAIVKTVNNFQADVLIHYGNQQADAREIFGIMMLCVPQGVTSFSRRKGPMPGRRFEAVLNLFAADFGL